MFTKKKGFTLIELLAVIVIVFTVLFGLYFFVCEVLSSGLVKMIVGA